MKTIQDLSSDSKWAMSDLPQFKQVMKEVEGELQKWEQLKVVLNSELRELDSDMLKGWCALEMAPKFLADLESKGALAGRRSSVSARHPRMPTSHGC